MILLAHPELSLYQGKTLLALKISLLINLLNTACTTVADTPIDYKIMLVFFFANLSYLFFYGYFHNLDTSKIFLSNILLFLPFPAIFTDSHIFLTDECFQDFVG